MNQRKLVTTIITGAVLLIVGIYVFNNIFVILEPGERGILFRKYTSGLDRENVLVPGLNIVAPWNDVYVYEVRENKVEERMDVIDNNGLTITVDVSVRYHPVYTRIAYLHENFGKDYQEKLIIPEVRSTVRRVMGRYTAEEIYSRKRAEVEQAIVDETSETLRSENNNIEMKALLIRSIILPDQLKNSIERKQTAEQEALAMEYIKQKELEEAARKKIAAQGEAVANQIINSSLTPSLLRMRGIEATVKLSESPNSKVIVIGSGEDGLPLILNGN